jgi:hypothetical protein
LVKGEQDEDRRIFLDGSRDTLCFIWGTGRCLAAGESHGCRRMLIPADARSSDQIEAYFRLAATFIINSCSPGQLLIVHGDAGQQVDVASLTQLANSSCVVSSIQRAEVPFTYAGRTRPGFELRCSILKKEELARRLADAERADPTDSLRARLAGTEQVDQATSATATKKDCTRVTLATLVQGGSRDCR